MEALAGGGAAPEGDGGSDGGEGGGGGDGGGRGGDGGGGGGRWGGMRGDGETGGSGGSGGNGHIFTSHAVRAGPSDPQYQVQYAQLLALVHQYVYQYGGGGLGDGGGGGGTPPHALVKHDASQPWFEQYEQSMVEPHR